MLAASHCSAPASKWSGCAEPSPAGMGTAPPGCFGSLGLFWLSRARVVPREIARLPFLSAQEQPALSLACSWSAQKKGAQSRKGQQRRCENAALTQCWSLGQNCQKYWRVTVKISIFGIEKKKKNQKTLWIFYILNLVRNFALLI